MAESARALPETGPMLLDTSLMSLDNPSEHSIQSKLIGQLAQVMRPELVCLAVPNGGLRHPLVAMKLKQEGLLPGSPDLVFALEDAGVAWLEMKNAKGRLSDVQVGLHAKLKRLGHVVNVASSVDEALDILNRLGVLR